MAWFIDGLPLCLWVLSGNRNARPGWWLWVDRRIFRKRVVRMRADRRGALVDFLLEAVADEGTTPFPTDVLAGLRRVVQC